MAFRIASNPIHGVLAGGQELGGAAIRGGGGGRRTPVSSISCRANKNDAATAAAAGGTTTKEKKAARVVHEAEELASRLGMEFAAADLERLFWSEPPPPLPGGGSPLRVAYQGARGSYCQEAAAAAFPSAAGHLACSDMEAAFAAVEEGDADRAVVPLENSLDGTIHRNVDLLLRHPGVRIAGEVLLPVNHCLLSLASARPSALRRVVSHPQALAHCADALRRLGLPAEEAPCAADAARLVAEGGIADTAVIGSRMAAREYGLRVVEQNLQDRPDSNVTRFLQLAPAAPPSLGASGGGCATKATVAFSLRNGPSGMFEAMFAMESRGVRVTRVDHRPNRARPVRRVAGEGEGERVYMDYVFVVDVEGEAEAVGKSVRRLEEIAGFLRVLGSYSTSAP